jgi:hypothetical protein
MRPTRFRGALPRWQGIAWYSSGSHRDIGTMSSFLDARAETAHYVFYLYAMMICRHSLQPCGDAQCDGGKGVRP